MKSREPWRNAERHYCAVCNAWMGSDRQSIIIHENGKKHIENLRKQMKERQQNKVKQERQQNILQRSLLQMEKTAALKQAEDSKFFGNRQVSSACTPVVSSYPILNISSSSHVSQIESSTTQSISNEYNKNLKKEMELWKDRKKRNEMNRENSSKNVDLEYGDKRKQIRKQLGPNEGHYSVNDQIYLKGTTYAPIIKKDMAIEIWTGFREAKSQDQQKIENQSYWKIGLICEIHKKKIDSIEISGSQDDDTDALTCDVAYLSNPSDEDETFENNVSLNRLRICVGSGNDDAESDIPGTLEEARLELMGGEEIINFETSENNANASSNILKEENILDENTGFSSWNTVSIRKVTVNKELKEERARLRDKRKLQREIEEQNKKKDQERKMEETKHSDANDSALGAYDVWNVSSKTKGNIIGYKGVDVKTENKVDHFVDAISKLSKKRTDVGFKKKKNDFGGNLKKKKFRRVTSADD